MNSRAEQVDLIGLTQLSAQAARSVPGVAHVAESDLRLRMSDHGVLVVDCTFTASADVRLHEVGLAVQLAIATVVQQASSCEVRDVNIYIVDIDERADPPVSSGALEKKLNYG
jgi:uncharacterized alkaline shock family protein YloU